MTIPLRVLGLVCGLAALSYLPSSARTFTYPELVSRLTDLEQLALLPPKGEETVLASSYDRRSKYDAAQDKYLEWGSNGDGGGVIRKEGDEAVLAEFTGPGCIERIWSATANEGHVKIYLDGSSTPAVDLPFADYFSGKIAPFNRPNLVYVPSAAAHGFDNYTPIPFQKSCKIVADPQWGSYYQFTYTKFPADTVVPTFRTPLSPEDNAALDRADVILRRSGTSPASPRGGEKVERKHLDAAPGQTATVADFSGAGAITALKVKLALPTDPEEQRVLLRQLAIQITWDDEKTPAVWSPLGDFFAYVGGATPFASLPVGLGSDGIFYSYWYMPFGRRAHIEVINDGPQSVAMEWEISRAPLDLPLDTLARFHEKWHRDAFLPQREDRKIDWTLLTTQGRGRFIGTHLHVWNPRGNWWGEGDDKFFVDGEKFPSTFGTGSEDYFGYAWSSSGLFSRPYHNQILNEGNSGHVDDNRWHIVDSVPFQKSFEGAIEKCFSNQRGTLYAANALWYLEPGGVDPYPPVPVADRIGYWVRPDPHLVPGSIPGNQLHYLFRGTHGAAIQEMWSYGSAWSGDQQLFWTPVAGDALYLDLHVVADGKYQIVVHLTHSPTYGISRLSLDDAPLGDPVDCYAPTLGVSDPLVLGTVDIKKGNHLLKVEPAGQNPASTGTNFGLDYVKLVLQP